MVNKDYQKPKKNNTSGSIVAVVVALKSLVSGVIMLLDTEIIMSYLFICAINHGVIDYFILSY